MPRSPLAQNAWITTLRWLYALLRRIWQNLRKLPSGVVWRLRIGAQKLRALLSYPHDRGGGNGIYEDHSGFSPYHPRDGVTDQNMQILPSRQPAQRDLNSPVPDDPTLEIQTLDSSQVGQPPVSPASSSSTATFKRASTSVDGPHTGCAQGISNIRAILPEKFRRYDGRKIIPRESVQHLVSAQTWSFASTDKLPNGWVTLLHPEGARYFSHPDRRIFTDVNVCEPQNLANVNQVVQRVLDNICVAGNEIPSCYAALSTGAPNPHFLVDLVIDLAPWDSHPTTGDYYFVNHAERCPFWLEDLPADDLDLWYSIEGPIQGEQLRHLMEYQYWQHCNMFPNALPLTQRLINELQDSIVYAIADVSTSLTSTVSRPVEDLKTWLSLVKHLECTHDSDEGLGYGFTFARLMDQFAKDRFDNFHGLPHARLNQDQSVYDPPGVTPRRSYWIICFSPILFFAPEVYLQSLEKSYVDRTVLLRLWKPLIHKLNTEWMDFILFTTVILNANVAFLSITSVDTLTDNGRHPLVQIASYLSIVTSIGSFSLGQLLVRQNRTKFHESASDISASVSRRSSKKYGLELLALIWALPYSLLMWSMIFFFVAFATECLRVPDPVTRSIIGVATAVLAVLVLWCIWDAWDMQDAHRPPTLFKWSRAIRDALHPIFSSPVSTKKKSRLSKLFSIRVAEKDIPAA